MNNLEELKKKYDELGAEIERLERLERGNKRWRAESCECYWYVYDDGITKKIFEYFFEEDDFRYKIRNYFQTEEEAQEHLDKINTYYELMDLAEELNNGEEIDWDSEDIDKYYLIFNSEKLSLAKVYTLKTIGNIYCLNNGFLEIAKERIGEERLIKLFK